MGVFVMWMILGLTLRAEDFWVAVSFSMPDGALKALHTQMEALGGTLVMRGLYKNSFAETAKKLHALGIAIRIDPEAFTRLTITAAPTFVWKNTHTLTGHISAKEALTRLTRAAP